MRNKLAQQFSDPIGHGIPRKKGKNKKFKLEFDIFELTGQVRKMTLRWRKPIGMLSNHSPHPQAIPPRKGLVALAGSPSTRTGLRVGGLGTIAAYPLSFPSLKENRSEGQRARHKCQNRTLKGQKSQRMKKPKRQGKKGTAQKKAIHRTVREVALRIL